MTRLLPRLDLQNAFVIVCVCVQNSKNGLHCAFNIQLHQLQITHNTRTLWNKIMSVQFGKQLNIGIGHWIFCA